MEQKQAYDYSTFGLTDSLPVSGMTVGMAITTFRQAKDRRLQLRSLAEQECCSEEDIKRLLLANGVSYKEMPRAPRKKATVEVKPEDTAKYNAAPKAEAVPDPTPAPAPRQAKISTASPPPPKKIRRSRPTPASRSCGSCLGRSSGTSPRSAPTATGNITIRIPGGVWSLIATSTPCCGT